MYNSRVGLSVSLLSSTTLATSRGLRPALSLNFLSGTLDPRITFTRSSQATVVDSTGKITYAPNNLLLRSQEFDVSSWLKTNATITANAADAPDGTTTADRLTSTGLWGIDQTAVLVASTIYILSVWVKSAGTGKDTFILYGDGNQTSSVFTATSTWTRVQHRFTSASSNSRGNGIFRDASNNPVDIYVWGAQLEAVTYQTTPSTYIPTTSAAYYGPRFDYDPVTLAAKGLLVEEQRSNLLLRSNEFGNASWDDATPNSATVSVNAASPDGTTNGATLTAATGGTGSMRRQALSAAGATAYTFSIYVKQGTATSSRFLVRDNTNGTNFIQLGALTWSSGAPVLGSITGTWTSTAAGNGWYRLTGTGTAGAGASVTLQASIFPDNAAGTGTLLVWGAQLEAGSFATSYIPTVASQVTRTADVATMTGANFSQWYNQSEGTFVVEASPLAVDNDIAFSVSNSSGYPNSIYIPADSGLQFVVVNGSVVQAAIDAGTITANAVNKIAAAYKVNDFAVSVGGGTVVSDTSGTIPTADRAAIGGQEGNTANRFNGWLRSIRYYPTRLSNAQLQALTA